MNSSISKHSAFTFVVLLYVYLVQVVRLCDAHSFMTSPDAYNRVFKTKSCRGSECSQACPNILVDSKMSNTPQRPGATWARGEKVMIKWAKNNHRGGGVRMSLVPIQNAMSRDWHARLAIYWGCWEQGMYRCEGDECGSDSDHEGFRREIVIPSVFPDGVYVLGVVWYGGLHFSRDRGMFPDYFSCSFVRIQGGVRVGGSYQPFFQDGDTGRFRRGGLCQMASSDAGECPKLGCTGRSFWGVPRPFQNGKKPRVLVTATVEKAFNGGADAGSTGGAVAVNKERGNDSNVKKPENIDEKKEKEDGTKEGRENEEKERNIDNIKEEGICRGSVCCLATCGQCGGSGCQRRPGGGPGCCMGVIRESGRDCRFVSAPCVR